MKETSTDKACRYLLEGRLTVTLIAPTTVQATTRGDGHFWHQHYAAGEWSCTCPARRPSCCHLQAVRRVVAIDLEAS